MATLVFLHAHPDDEASQTAGSMARAAAEAHRVVTAYATGGEQGDVPDDLAPGETLADRRRREAQASAAVIGVHRIAWLGYADSGMAGWAQNGHDGAFARADLDEAAGRLAAILDEERADVVVGYDWHGGYGHPDHVRVHSVAHRAADLVSGRRPRVLESTMNRDRMREGLRAAREAGLVGAESDEWDPDQLMDDGNPLGEPEAVISWQVDVSDRVDQRRAALAAHASQGDVRQILAMPSEVFGQTFAFEHYIEPGRPPGMRRGWFLDPD